MILQIGIILIASITTIASANVFYDAVENAVLGDPTIAAKTLASYTDFVDSSAVPINIYHEIPTDFMGNPGYGTVLFNPVECEYTLSKYPQDYMSNLILNSAWDTVTLEEGLLYYSLYKYNKNRNSISSLSKIATEAGQDLSTRELQTYRENQYKYKQYRKAFERQGYNLDEINKAIIRENFFNEISVSEQYRTLIDDQYINEVENLKNIESNAIKEAKDEWSIKNSELTKLTDQQLVGQYQDKFDFYWDDSVSRYRNKNTGQFVSDPANDILQPFRNELRNDAFSEMDTKIKNIEAQTLAEMDELNRLKSEGNEAVEKSLDDALSKYNQAFDEIDPKKNPRFAEALDELYRSTGDKSFEAVGKNSKTRITNAIPGVKAYRNYKVKKVLEKSTLVTSNKLAKKKLTQKAGSATLALIKSPLTAARYGASAVKTTAIESAERASKRIKFLGKVTGLNKLYTIAAKQTSNRIGKSAARSLTVKATTEVAEPACSLLVFGAPICVAAVKGMSWASYALEFGLTYVPIVFFMNKAQKATEAVENSFSTMSCKSKDRTYYVSKPNCQSESVLNYPEFDNTILGSVQIFEDITEGIFAMPSSAPIFESKTYPNIINSENNCVDSHNNLLSKDSTPEVFQDTLINPRETVASIPFGVCGGITAAKASWGPGCTFGWGVLYLGSWASPEISNSISSYFAGGTLALFAGPSAIALTTAFLANPIDSKSFFPYISKSGGMIDSDNNYYIENPLVIEISKKDHNGVLITEINKVL